MVGTFVNAFHEVLGHPIAELAAAHDHDDLAGVVDEMHGRLSGGIAGADDVDHLIAAVQRFRAGGAVIDAAPFEVRGALGRQPLPRQAHRQDQRLAGDLARHGARRSAAGLANLEVLERAVNSETLDVDRVEHFDVEAMRLSQRVARQIVSRHAIRKSEIVLDPARRSRLAAWRLAVEQHRRQALRGGVHRRRETGRTGADDRDVVGRLGRFGLEPGSAARHRRRRDWSGAPRRA